MGLSCLGMSFLSALKEVLICICPNKNVKSLKEGLNIPVLSEHVEQGLIVIKNIKRKVCQLVTQLKASGYV